ncbi:hypothetical protein AAE478_009562 [Parahypoxylon ruwenzoriense]
MAEPTDPTARSSKKSVFVTGANGYLGFAVCRAFVRAGWHTYGLVRRPESANALAAEEIIPIIGSVSPDASIPENLYKHTQTVDVIVSCTEQIPFGAHYEALATLFRELAQTSNAHGVRPLVLFSSGCKDYGMTGVHGEPGLAPHTEESPLRPVDFLRERTYSSLKIFEHSGLFDAAVIRPTPLFGYSSSYYGFVLELAAAAAQTPESALKIPVDFNTIIHGCHIDDCAEAYLALAEYPERGKVAGQCFNISGCRYETLGELATVLATEYGLHGGVVRATSAEDSMPGSDLVFGFSQWVDSTKIRQLTGWADRRMLLSENVHAYRLAYEEAARRGDQGILRVKERFGSVFASAGI